MRWQTVSQHAHCDTSQDDHCMWSWRTGVVDARSAHDAARAHAEQTGHVVLVERHQVAVVVSRTEAPDGTPGRGGSRPLELPVARNGRRLAQTDDKEGPRS